ncbi:efflux RND transporter periplasmic adaptor subunit [Fulvivirga ligni]|uniref:efflux RND transporter periplasmic adaptor subunit n=1 Tax=Fulvivirga ligni TaxID=2904246 RepID=UPI001F2549A5|nr:efflux RND transporter periplasmic adaptor subunit [Fulvivirga ligni]UII21523.1 efflux RND transporter periplasmic adaptor subunit [Fulvivirga ligni]
MKRIFMIMSLCALLGYTSCESKKEKQEHESKFSVTSPVRLDTSLTKEYVCQIRSIQHIELRAQEKGYLEKIFVDEGQTVKKGQLLFKIMPKLYEAEQSKAKAEARAAQIELKNIQSLADSNIVSQNELAMAEAEYEKANAELALANVHLGFTEIRAPFDGIIDRFHVRQGSLVNEEDLLTNLSDNSEMWVYFNVPEAEYLDYREKVKKDSTMNVKLLMANNKMFSYPGEVKTIEADFNNETGNIPFRATFPNPDKLLRHGETGSILMTTPLKHAMIIPQKTTFEVLDKRYVFVIDKEHKVRARPVEIAAEMPHLYVVSGGIKEDDQILLEGLRLVKEGDEIETEFVEPKKAITGLDLYAE